MDEKTGFRLDKETMDILEKLKKELNISRSDVIRMSIRKFYNYVKKVNK